MTALRIWARRGLGLPVGAFVAGIILTTLLTQPDWRVEMDWATRLTASSVLLVCPIIAAAAAFDTSSRFRPAIGQLSLASTRRRWNHMWPAFAVGTWAVASYALVWVIAAGVVWRAGGVGITDWWVFPEIILPVLTASLCGLAIGMLVSGRLAAPLAAVVVFSTSLIAAPWGRGPFEAVPTFGTLTGLQRAPARASFGLAGVICLSLLFLAIASELHRSQRARRSLVSLGAVVAATVAVLPAALPWSTTAFVTTRETYGCLGQNPRVCGPKSRLPLLEPVAISLRDAYAKLQGTDFVQPREFRITRYDDYSQLHGDAPLDFDPAYIKDGRYSIGATVNLLLRPHQCKELFSATSAVPILEAQDRTAPWLAGVLQGRRPARPVPDAIKADFALTRNCTVLTGSSAP